MHKPASTAIVRRWLGSNASWVIDLTSLFERVFDGTTDQQHCAKVYDETKNPAETRRLWPNPEREATVKAARHVAADLRDIPEAIAVPTRDPSVEMIERAAAPSTKRAR